MGRTGVLQEIRMLRFEEIHDRFTKGRLSAAEAAEWLGVSERTFRRQRRRFEEEGELGQGGASPAPLSAMGQPAVAAVTGGPPGEAALIRSSTPEIRSITARRRSTSSRWLFAAAATSDPQWGHTVSCGQMNWLQEAAQFKLRRQGRQVGAARLTLDMNAGWGPAPAMAAHRRRRVSPPGSGRTHHKRSYRAALRGS